ncbi:hypothetical protein C2E25_05320 [Geothermobacter hydrogeniphilus]|uniref:Type IV pilus assembly protein PilO n=1 Tax=Geothermobacter hydrogeniphilus TaxID=1969733 RepID=A0A2K2HBY2_9BACT|nr:type 4a pilus biogenesis protein PilO [Geothermobacter hydrogeniphilus]PNU20806.1 hypothetical protein C2E25_05320 [Geothermobacter hydrogeniphilus]
MKQILARLRAIWCFNRLWPLLVLALLVLDLLLYGFINLRVSPDLERKERTFIELQARARRAQKLSVANQSPRQAFLKARRDLEKFKQRIPGRDGLSALVGEIYGFARDTGLDIKAINYQPKKSKGHDLLEYPLTFSISGEYRQVKEFISLIEQSPRLIAIDNLSLDSDGKDAGSVKLSIRMTTYFRLEPA